MTEQRGGEMFSALTGGQDALAMLQRMERLKKLMGTVSAVPKEETVSLQEADTFSSRKENMISAAIPFLDQEYQREIYVIVRLMEMQRVLNGGLLEVREKQEIPPALRRQQMLRAVQGYLPEQEQKQLDTLLKMMTMREIMGREDKK